MRCAKLREYYAGLIALMFLLALLSGSAAAKTRLQVIYAFSDCTGSTAPLITDESGNLYGTTLDGGAYKGGCVFELSRNTDGSWSKVLLYSFSGVDGSAPAGSLAFDKLGNLYGTTETGGIYGGGVAFELSPSPDGAWTETVLHNFGTVNDGFGPQSELAFDNSGNLYGTTSSGGDAIGRFRGGTVYKLSPGQDGWTETILYSFPGHIAGPNGDSPVGGVVIDSQGSLYGVTGFGGANGAGAVYKLIPSNGGYKERVIFSFNGYDGLEPSSSLVMGPDGNLYGTTSFGGDFTGCPSVGCGTVFELTKVGQNKWTETVLFTLDGTDGVSAMGPVAFDRAGNLYAAAQFGGINAGGSVYKLTPTRNGTWREIMLHRFNFHFPNGVDGAQPYAGVVVNRGQIFGTTTGGGIHGEGTVFRITSWDSNGAAPPTPSK